MKLVKESTFDVEGMTCQGCVNSIRTVLGRLDGVDSVRVDLAASRVSVRHDVRRADRRTLITAIESAGYRASRVPVNTDASDLAQTTRGPAE